MGSFSDTIARGIDARGAGFGYGKQMYELGQIKRLQDLFANPTTVDTPQEGQPLQSIPRQMTQMELARAAAAIDPSNFGEEAITGGGGNSPMSVKEWQYFNSLSDEEKAQYLQMKRAVPSADLGTQYQFFNPYTLAPSNGYNISPRQSEMPDFRYEQSRQTEQGKILGQRAAGMEDAEFEATNMINLVDEVLADEEGLRSAVGGAFGMKGRQSSFMPLSSAQRRIQPKLDQLSGKAFLMAREKLKGAGSLSDTESAQGAAAEAALSQAQDYDDYVKALRDWRAIIEIGLWRKKNGIVVNEQKGARAVLEAKGKKTTAPTPQGGAQGKPADISDEIWNEMTPQQRELFK